MAKHRFGFRNSPRSIVGASGRGRRIASGRHRPFGAIERLEDRALLTTTLYIDFGEGFNQQLLTTVAEIEQQLGGPLVSPIAPTAPIQLIPLRNVMQRLQIDFVPGGGRGDLTDYLALRESIVNIVRRQYSPFDVNVQVVAARDAADIRAIMDRNAGDPTGQFDSYVTVTGIFEPSGASTGSGSLGFPAYLGVSSPLDIFGANVNDSLVVLDADVIWQAHQTSVANPLNRLDPAIALDTMIAGIVSHEAGHGFSLRHTNAGGAPLFNLDVALLSSSDIMREGGVSLENRETVSIFTRFPLPQGDGNTNLALTWNAFDQLANDPDIGLRVNAPAYVTGTGAFDRITITSIPFSQSASVTVEAFNDAAFINSIGTHTYQIDTSRGIVIEAGNNADRIVIDALVNTSIDVFGGRGADELEVRGVPTMNASYLPTPTWSIVPGQETYNGVFPQRMISYGGTVIAGNSTIRYSEFDDAGAVTFSNMASAAFTGSEGFDNLSVRGVVASTNEIDGTIGGVGFPNMRYANVRSVVINAGAAAVTDAVTINTVNAPGLAFLTVFTGAGDDFINVTTANLQFPVAGGSMILNFGAGRDTLNAVADTDWTLTDLTLTGTLGGTVALQEFFGENANLVGGPGNNTFRTSGWSGVGLIVGQGGTDTIEMVRDLNFSFGENFVNMLGVGGFRHREVENLRLTGGPGSNTFFDYGWNGTATLDGGLGATDMIAGIRDGNMRLTDTMYFAGPSGGFGSSTVTLNNIELASLNGLSGFSQFDVSGRTTPAAVNGGGGQDVLIHNRNVNVTLTNSALFVSGPATNFFSLSGIEIAHLTGGAGDNTITISQWAGSGFVNAVGGNDIINIASGSLDAVAGFWNIIGGLGADQIIVNDQLGPGGNYLVGTNSLSIAPGTGRRFGAIFYDGTSENLRLNANNGPNRIDVTPSLGTTFTIDGNAPGAPSGDTLVVHTAFTGMPNGPMNGPGPGQRRFTFNAGHRDVIFEDIEQVLGAP